MKRERILEFVGGSDDEVAYLRLLIRRAAVQLEDKWRLRRDGDEHVDLLVIADNGEEALAPGAPRRVRLVDPAFGAAGMETVHWPLSLEQLVKLFNLTGVAAAQPPAGPAITHNVYDDLFDSEPSDRWKTSDNLLDSDADWMPPADTRGAELMHEAEAFFRHDPREQHRDALKSIRLPDHVDVEATEGKTEWGIARKDKRGALASGLVGTLHTLTTEEAESRHPLSAFLSGRLLPGPSRAEVAGIALTLDPRNRQYYARGALCVLAEMCRSAPRRGDWRTLSTGDFAAVRERLPARPYLELRWLCAWIEDAPAELDDGLRYRLIERIDLAADYPREAQVVRALAQGSTLSDAAFTAGVPIIEVRRIAAALDAIGALLPE
ncbi:MAG: hypothetical protein IT479_01710 [Xanthomonadales bacterium]|nr:hypothetical protein [Xanthomonadales bacterium]MCC6591966.1 hypothetical protein [Xanthomonadales bacterium]MCE7929907.1 hypothetical protein [Xanthomonadales bacterium PRO6]